MFRPLTLLLILASTGLALAEPAPLLPLMPQTPDFTLLWWAHGPPHYLGMKGDPPEPILCLQSGNLGCEIETRKLQLLHVGRLGRPVGIDEALREGNAGLSKLPALKLELTVRRGDKTYVCTGRSPTPADEFLFPVRFIESGHFLQHVSIEDLEFADSDGKALDVKGRLEIALWPDRLTFTAEVPRGKGELSLIVGTQRASVTLVPERRVTLTLLGPSEALMPTVAPADGARVERDATLGCQVVRLSDRPWKNSKATYYPSDELDRLDRWHFTLKNDSDRECTAPLMFVPDHEPAITGLTPMLCEADGTPTGIPVQISKDWHARPEKGTVLHEGIWLHACTLVRLPPHAQHAFVFQLAYANYGGVPAASHAQLCLIGYGHNQFWDESAIGSFGESVCYEPGRVQRRCMIDDVRPLMTLTKPGEKPYSWADNTGGGDFLMWVDASGNYQGFEQTRTNHLSQGPCLTHAAYFDQTTHGEIVARMDASIGRSDDYVRAFHHIRYDVKKPVIWKRLAFYQLGADNYNETAADHVAIGDVGGMKKEWETPHSKNAYDRRSVPLSGAHPWISIHGVHRRALKDGQAAATKGLVVRSWKAVLGGRECKLPHLYTYATEQEEGMFRTVVELSPPGDVSELQPGDFVDAELEMLVFPADSARYYGPNAPFREALAQNADTWGLVHREAAGNALEVAAQKGTLVHAYPLVMIVDPQQHAACTIEHGLGFVPVTFSGLSSPTGYELVTDGRPLDQSVHGKDFWQTEFDVEHKTWTMTFNIVRDGAGKSLLEFHKK